MSALYEYYNDISVLEVAGTGGAMGNAGEAVQGRADDVIGSNTADSIAKFIDTDLL